MARIITKQHVREGNLTLAVCDDELLGKEFEEGKLYLNISETFYGGADCTEEDLRHLLNGAKTANIVGTESIAIAKEVFPELIVKTVQGIPFAIMIRG